MTSWTPMSEQVVLSEDQMARATAIAKRLSEIESAEERLGFARQSRFEEGYEDGPEPCGECDGCKRQERYDLAYAEWTEKVYLPWENSIPDRSNREAHRAYWATEPKWSWTGENGTTDCLEVERILADSQRAERERRASVKVEQEWLHEQLARMQVRMMRPYEHWNEDEQRMEMAESGNYPALAW